MLMLMCCVCSGSGYLLSFLFDWGLTLEQAVEISSTLCVAEMGSLALYALYAFRAATLL